MAKIEGYISINGTDLTSSGRNVSWDHGTETLDDTAFGDSARSAAGGLETGGFTATFNQGFGSGSVDATLNGLVGTVVPVVWGPGGATASASNPHYSRSMLITAYNPGSGSVGDQMTATVSGVAAGAQSRVTS